MYLVIIIRFSPLQIKSLNYGKIEGEEENEEPPSRSGVIGWSRPRYYPRQYFFPIMYESSYRVYLSHYYSPSNSSLLFNPTGDKFRCVPGENYYMDVPLMYAAVNTSKATLHVQVGD